MPERAAAPIFDIAVEMSRGQFNECRDILDVAQAVDSILEGRAVAAQTRRRVLVLKDEGGGNGDSEVLEENDDIFESVSSSSE
ncbi:hypothetical protein EON65_45400 [archaeon]|nr:MAG: hypothetical protein EON65_45400 [archaeon]